MSSSPIYNPTGVTGSGFLTLAEAETYFPTFTIVNNDLALKLNNTGDDVLTGQLEINPQSDGDGILLVTNAAITENILDVNSSSNSVNILNIELGKKSTTTGQILFDNSTNNNQVGFEAGITTTPVVWKLPLADGTMGQLLSTDGSGNLSFVANSEPIGDFTSITVQPTVSDGQVFLIENKAGSTNVMTVNTSTNLVSVNGGYTGASGSFQALRNAGGYTGSGTMYLLGGVTGNDISATTIEASGLISANAGISGGTGWFNSGITGKTGSFTTIAASGQINSVGYSGTVGAFTGQINSAGYSGTVGAFTGQINSAGYSGTVGAFTGLVNASGFSGSTGTFQTGIEVGKKSTTIGEILFDNATNNNQVGFQSGTTTTSVTWTLPVADGTANQVLSTNGSGVLSFVNAGGGAETFTSVTIQPTTSDGQVFLIENKAGSTNYVTVNTSTGIIALNGGITGQSLALSGGFTGTTISGSTLQTSGLITANAGISGSTGWFNSGITGASGSFQTLRNAGGYTGSGTMYLLSGFTGNDVSTTTIEASGLVRINAGITGGTGWFNSGITGDSGSFQSIINAGGYTGLTGNFTELFVQPSTDGVCFSITTSGGNTGFHVDTSVPKINGPSNTLDGYDFTAGALTGQTGNMKIAGNLYLVNSLEQGSTTNYHTGTVGTGGSASTTITGSGTTWTNAMIGGLFIIISGSSVIAPVLITSVASNTSLTVASSLTITNGTSYNIIYGGYLIDSNSNISQVSTGQSILGSVGITGTLGVTGLGSFYGGITGASGSFQSIVNAGGYTGASGSFQALRNAGGYTGSGTMYLLSGFTGNDVSTTTIEASGLIRANAGITGGTGWFNSGITGATGSFSYLSGSTATFEELTVNSSPDGQSFTILGQGATQTNFSVNTSTNVVNTLVNTLDGYQFGNGTIQYANGSALIGGGLIVEKALVVGSTSIYQTGTVSTSGSSTTVTGSGTTFTHGMEGGIFITALNNPILVISASGTALILASAVNLPSNTNYFIRYGVNQIDSLGNESPQSLLVSNTNSNALVIKNGSGSSIFTVDTSTPEVTVANAVLQGVTGTFNYLRGQNIIEVGYNDFHTGQLLFNNSSNTNQVGFQAGVTTTPVTWTLPLADSAGVFTSNGSGILSIQPTGSLTNVLYTGYLAETTNSYSTGTISTVGSSTSVIGVGTTFTSGMVGGILVYGSVAVLITGFTNTTHITIATAETIGALTNYTIYYNNLVVDQLGNLSTPNIYTTSITNSGGYTGLTGSFSSISATAGLTGNTGSFTSISATAGLTGNTGSFTYVVGSTGQFAGLTGSTGNFYSGIELGKTSTSTGTLLFDNSTNANQVGFQAGVTTTPVTWTLPLADGTSGQVLQTNGSGVLSFVSESSPTTPTFQSVTITPASDGVAFTLTNAAASADIVTMSTLTGLSGGTGSFSSLILSGGMTGTTGYFNYLEGNGLNYGPNGFASLGGSVYGTSTDSSTITCSGSTVTGSGTTFTKNMVGGLFALNNDISNSQLITAFGSSTSLTISGTLSIGSASNYIIYYNAFQGSYRGYVGVKGLYIDGTGTYLDSTGDLYLSGGISGTTGQFTGLLSAPGGVTGNTGSFTFVAGSTGLFTGGITGATGSFSVITGSAAGLLDIPNGLTGSTGSFQYILIQGVDPTSFMTVDFSSTAENTTVSDTVGEGTYVVFNQILYQTGVFANVSYNTSTGLFSNNTGYTLYLSVNYSIGTGCQYPSNVSVANGALAMFYFIYTGSGTNFPCAATMVAYDPYVIQNGDSAYGQSISGCGIITVANTNTFGLFGLVLDNAGGGTGDIYMGNFEFKTSSVTLRYLGHA